MHTAKIIALGFLLLAASLYGGRVHWDTDHGVATAAALFCAMWIFLFGINFLYDVYGRRRLLQEEAVMFLVQGGVPALAGATAWYLLR